MCIFRGSTSFVEYLKRKLDGVDQRLNDLENGSKHSDKDSMDLKTTKNALDQHKVDINLLYNLVLSTGLIMSIGHCKEIRKLVYKTKLSCYTSHRHSTTVDIFLHEIFPLILTAVVTFIFYECRCTFLQQSCREFPVRIQTRL